MATTTVVVLATAMTPSLSITSPYRRPDLLQPRRLLAEGYALAGEKIAPVGRLGIDIEVRDAGPRGRGLFALRDFEAGERVCRYTGVLATDQAYREAWYAGLTSGAYIAKANLDGTIVVDSDSDRESGPGRYINHSKLWRNVRILSYTIVTPSFLRESIPSLAEEVPTGVVYMVATRPVAAGSEFLADYGPEYWSSARRPDGKTVGMLDRFLIDCMP